MDLYDIKKSLNMGVSLSSMKLRVTNYVRVSTQHIEQQSSLKNQIKHFDEMIKENKNWTYIPGYIDDGLSGTTAYKRNNFMKMIDDARQGKFDLIITKEISRFSRNTLDSIQYTRELLSYGVAVLFVNDNINTALPDSELRLTIMASMAQDEIRRLSERVKFGMNRSIKNGTILGNDMLYGYQKDQSKGNLIIIDKEANIVKKIFSLYAINNWSISKIAKLLNAKEIKTRQNKKWCVSTLSRMIKNPKYKGFYCGKKSEVIDYMTKKVKAIPKKEWILYQDNLKIPPIVNEVLWERANKKLLLRNKSFGNDYKETKIMYQNRYPLSAKIFCKLHDEVFHRRKLCKASNDISWICSKYLQEGKQKCNSPIIRESEIYKILEDIFLSFNIKLSNVADILLELYKSHKTDNEVNKEIQELNKKQNILLTKKDKLLELNIEGNLSKKEFKKKYQEYNEQLSVIKQNIILLEKKPQIYNDNNLRKNIQKMILQNTKNNIINNHLIKLLLKKIVVSKINDNKENIKLEIFYNISDIFWKKEDNHLIEKNYLFKRGYNTTGTKRYIVKYQVFSRI